MHLSYSGPLASWHCYSFILSYLCLWLSVWCFETGAHSQRAAACQEDTWPRARFSPICHQLMAPWAEYPSSQGISSLLTLSCPFPHLNALHSKLPDLLAPHTQTLVNVQVNTWVQASKAIAMFLCAVYDPIGLFVLLYEHKFTRNSNTSNLLSDDRSPKTKCLLP